MALSEHYPPHCWAAISGKALIPSTLFIPHSTHIPAAVISLDPPSSLRRPNRKQTIHTVCMLSFKWDTNYAVIFFLCTPCSLEALLNWLMYSFHRSRLSYDLEILYDLGVDFRLILDGLFVLGCPWLNLTYRGQYQTGLIFPTTTMILLIS